MSERRPRRILPAAPREQLSLEADVAEPDPPPKNRGKGVTRISTACEACKRRKTRCSGPPAPCQLCLIQSTTCIIDESLDQRRKPANQRLIESISGHQQFLTALIRTIRYSEEEDLGELISGIRYDQSPTEIATLLGRKYENLREHEKLEPVAISELQIAFKATEAGDLFEEGALSTSTSETFALGESSTRGSSVAVPTQEPLVDVLHTGSERLGATDPRQIYERWISLFGSELDNLADIRSEEHPHPENAPTPWGIGLWRRHPEGGSAEEGWGRSTGYKITRQSETARLLWHPALQIQESSQDITLSDMTLSSGEEAQFSEQAELIRAQGFGETGEWVQTLRAIPRPVEMLESDVIESKVAYDLEFSKYPLYAVQPATISENSMLSNAITIYRDAARGVLAQGARPLSILGHDGIDVDLFFRDRTPEDGFTVSQWASEFWRRFPDWDLFVRLACCLTFTYLMRWTLMPTAKRYADIPDMLKPLPSQRVKGHHVAIDLLPIPPLREALINNFRDFMTALPAAKISVNWTGTLEEAIIRDDEAGTVRLTEVFEKHVTKASNWSIGRSILASFPELQGTVRLDPEN